MKRFVVAFALAGLMSMTVLAGEVPTNGVVGEVPTNGAPATDRHQQRRARPAHRALCLLR